MKAFKSKHLVPGKWHLLWQWQKMFLNYKIKYCKPATYFISDFSKLIHRLLVKYTIESRISNAVVFGLISHLILHSDRTHVIIHLQYVILHLYKDTYWHSTEKEFCRSFTTLTSKTTINLFLVLWSFPAKQMQRQTT